jgi:hypothetical protein
VSGGAGEGHLANCQLAEAAQAPLCNMPLQSLQALGAQIKGFAGSFWGK